MKRYLLRVASIVLMVLLIGSSVDSVTDVEQELGLDTLFRIRGPRPAPKEVVVVAMDETSEVRFNLGQDLSRWRGYHARLIQQLQQQSVALIVFDLQFIAAHADDDPEFAARIKTAGNVLFTDCVQLLRRGVEDFYGRDECSGSNQKPFVERSANAGTLSEQLVALRRIPANPLLLQAALDHAPFYVTNDPEHATVREGWFFLDTLAEAPTLPTVAWIYYLQLSHALPNTLNLSTPASQWLTTHRRNCFSLPDKAKLHQFVNPIVADVLCRAGSRFLDFYGPSQSLHMESYSDVYDGKVSDLTGKVIFVGKANRLYAPGKTDFFQTPFSYARGKTAGVEIMASQFANLLENRFITSPVPPNLILLVYAIVMAGLLTQLNGIAGIGSTIFLSGIYAGAAVWLFKQQGLWLPVAVPILLELPSAWLVSLLFSRYDLIRERKRILDFVSRVFPKWVHLLPARPGEWYPEINREDFPFTQNVHGLCLATDIQGYTPLTAQRSPQEIMELLKAYYQVLGQPVSSHNGIIADVTGDAMMAFWMDSMDKNYRQSACFAALEMQQAVQRFNENSSIGKLPTRFGLHQGDINLGRLDAGGSSYYRIFGETVPTASRIEGVNKMLGTRILASASIVAGLVELVYRPVGFFRVVGLDEPLQLMELIGLAGEVSAAKLKFFQQFGIALNAFTAGDWQEAATKFQALRDKHLRDGPTQYYLALALRYLDNPPADWHGVITLASK